MATARPARMSIRNVLTGTLASVQANAGTPFAELTIRVGEQVLHARVTRAAVADLGLTTDSDIYALVKSVSFDRDA